MYGVLAAVNKDEKLQVGEVTQCYLSFQSLNVFYYLLNWIKIYE